MTVSLHETPAYLFPGTGFPNEIGGRGAEGTAVNVALPPGTTDADWLRAFHAIVPQCFGAQPTVLVTQHGCDSHSTIRWPTSTSPSMGSAPRILRSRALPRNCVRALDLHWRRWLRGAQRGSSGLDPPTRHCQRRANRSNDVGPHKPGGLNSENRLRSPCPTVPTPASVPSSKALPRIAELIRRSLRLGRPSSPS
jgi:hypothetical protein